MTDGDVEALHAEAEEFAAILTCTVRAVAPGSDPFIATILDERVRVVQKPGEGVSLDVDGVPLLTLKANFGCCWDDHARFLSVERSRIAVFAGSASQPLFRYEYERSATSVPAAHLHVHAHRDALTFALSRAGSSTRRGSRRAEGHSVPAVQDVHFPLGGHRFRPALEDVLEMLVDEFGVDQLEGSLAELRDVRAQWRRIQTRAAVRDAPRDAADSLRALGYTITWDHDVLEPADRLDRLEAL